MYSPRFDETRRRREIQEEYNREHGITPETIKKHIRAGIESEAAAHRRANEAVGKTNEADYITDEYLNELEEEMMASAKAMEFERAATIRDRIMKLREQRGEEVEPVKSKAMSGRGRRRGKKGGAKIPRPKGKG